MKKILTLVLVSAIIFACNTNKEINKNELHLKVAIPGMDSGTVKVGFMMSRKDTSIQIQDGRFEYKTTLNEPAELSISVPSDNIYGGGNYVSFWVEAGEILVRLDDEDFSKDPVIEGSSIYNDSKKYDDKVLEIYPEDPYALYKEMSPLYSKTDEASKAKLEELQKKADVVREKNWAAKMEAEEWFIDNHSDSYYAAILVRNRNSGKRGGKSLKEVEAEVARLSPEIQKTPVIQRLLKHNSEVAKTDVNLADLVKGTGDVNYKKDASFDGSQFKNIKYLASFSNGNICALDAMGTVSIISPEGKHIRNIEFENKSQINAIAVSPDDKIYVPNVLKEKGKVQG